MAKKKPAKKPGIIVHCKYDKLLKTDSLKPHPANPATHSDEQVTLLAKIMKSHGIRWPIVVSKRSGFIVAGHCRRRAAMMLGVEYPVVFQDYTDENEELAVLVADNKIAELSGVDGQVMADVLVQLDQVDYPLELTAIPEVEIHDYILGPITPDPKDDVVPPVPKKPQTKAGDLYRIGKHRLLCGDATKSEDVERVMDGEKADMVFTDPPYGMNLDTNYSKLPSTKQEGNKNYNSIIGDDSLFDASAVYGCNDAREQFWFGADYYAKTLGDTEQSGSWIVWDKRVTEKFDAMIGSAFELIWSNVKHKRGIIRCNNTLFSGEKEARDKNHPTQKPTRVIEWILDKYSKVNNLIYDPFLGSGTTIIAAEKLNRKCYGLEIDPIYCDVIVKRWEQFTGKTAKPPTRNKT